MNILDVTFRQGLYIYFSNFLLISTAFNRIQIHFLLYFPSHLLLSGFLLHLYSKTTKGDLTSNTRKLITLDNSIAFANSSKQNEVAEPWHILGEENN